MTGSSEVFVTIQEQCFPRLVFFSLIFHVGFTPCEMFPLCYYHKTVVADNDIKTRTKNMPTFTTGSC